MCPKDNLNEPERATISEGVSPEVLEPSDLKGSALARFHLTQAQERAKLREAERATERAKQLELDQAKRDLALNELKALRAEITETAKPDPTLDKPSEPSNE